MGLGCAAWPVPCLPSHKHLLAVLRVKTLSQDEHIGNSVLGRIPWSFRQEPQEFENRGYEVPEFVGFPQEFFSVREAGLGKERDKTYTGAINYVDSLLISK